MSDWNSYEALLTEGYRRCAKLTWRYGTTYFWGAVLLLSRNASTCTPSTPSVGLPTTSLISRMGNTRSALIRTPCPQSPSPSRPSLTRRSPITMSPRSPNLMSYTRARRRASNRQGRLEDFAQLFRSSLVAGDSRDPVMAAVVHTVITCDIDPECFDRFFGAMAMDLTTTSYQTWEDLRTYMEGSAAVIGEMMLPVLEPFSQAAKAPARSLGWPFSSPSATLTKILIEAGSTYRKMIFGSLMLILDSGE